MSTHHQPHARLRSRLTWTLSWFIRTPESKFVKDLDQFELAVQAVEYENCEPRATRTRPEQRALPPPRPRGRSTTINTPAADRSPHSSSTFSPANNISLQEFFQSTVPRIQHSTARQWARDLMEERRTAWAARGWDYVPVLVKEDEKVEGAVAEVVESAKGMTLEEAREERGESVRIPTRVWGEHTA